MTMIHNHKSACAALALAAAFATGVRAAQEIVEVEHVTVRREEGRFFGWPANGGIWCWGNEILVQYRAGEFQNKPVGWISPIRTRF